MNSEPAAPSQSESGDPAGAPPSPKTGWLRSIASASEHFPARLASASACGLLALMVVLELRSTSGLTSIPIYYLLPIGLFAWFAGLPLAFLAATAAFAVTLPRTLQSGSATVFLARLITFVVAALFARGLRTSRLMLGFLYWGPQWRAARKPARVGSHFLIVPVLETDGPMNIVELPPDVVPIYIQPGLAFGTSSHPTTQMCLELLERYLAPGAVVLDVGCGTGILGIAAAKLGALRVDALDINLEAIHIASMNLAHNQVSHKVTIHHGSLDVVNPTPPSTTRQFDLILANLISNVIKDLLQTGLPAMLARGGVFIASGIRSTELGSIQAALHAAGLRLDQSVERDRWCALAAHWQ